MLNEREMDLLSEWERMGIIEELTPEKIAEMKSGNHILNVACGDDRIHDYCCQTRRFATDVIMDTTELYGLPALFSEKCHGFKDFFDCLIIGIIKLLNLVVGSAMEKKPVRDVGVVDVYSHWPCGLALAYSNVMEDAPYFAIDCEKKLREGINGSERILFRHFLHVRLPPCDNCHHERKRTYIFHPYVVFK